ncbi:hypothetical protein KUTeg_006246 [Tegillarca granosa]|uniref:Nephrin n=1 Tax=Tegillarca granosa TaxID=220873 RepID=A0ABQ9FI73_TEGGR|nr:hypothetical protein KUTeg_006246 [Tegillarca granosa]
MRDDANFECQVGPANGEPFLRSSANLTIIVPPEFPEILGYRNGVTVDIPYTQHLINFTCLVRNARPAATIKWYRNDQLVTQGIQTFTEPIVGDKRENTRSILTIGPSSNHQQEQGAVYKCNPPSEPIITGYSSDQEVRAGDNLRLICISRGGNPLAQVIWFKNDVTEDISYESGRNRSENELSFQLKKSDNGAVFRCEASNPVTPQPLVEQKVTITGNKLAKAGESIDLTCESSNSNPAAVITWISRGRQIAGTTNEVSESADGGFITKSSISVTLSGQENNVLYECHAINDQVGTVPITDTVTLNPPGPPMIIGYNENDIIKAGDLLHLKCQSVGGNPPATLKWYKGDEELDSEVTVGNTVSASLAVITKRNDNNAIYTCKASNEATPVPLEALPKSVTVTAFPQIGKAGEQLTLTCITASSNPAASVTWVTRNKQIRSNNTGISPSDNGGMTTTNVLKFTPTYMDNDKPVFNISTSRIIEMKEGEKKDIDFAASANPSEVIYSLYKGEMEVDTFTIDKGVMKVSSIERQNSGSYVIQATNSEGSTNYNFSINIDIITSPVAEDEKGTAVFECVASANPRTNNMIVWTRPNFDMSKTKQTYEDGKSILTVHELKREDSGTFTCTADNGIGDPAVKEAQLVEGYDVSGGKYSTTDDKLDGTYQSILTVTDVTKAEYGTYMCTASNEKGTDTFTIKLDGTTITISWKPGFDGGLDQWYIIRYKAANTQENTFIEIKNPHRTVFTIKGLQRGTTYKIAVFSENIKGRAEQKPQEITRKTADIAPTEEHSLVTGTDDTPVIVIMVVCVVGIFLLALNIGLILDTTSHTNTIELYGPSKETALYPLPNHDDNPSYGTYEKNMDDLSDDYRNYEQHSDEKSMHSSNCNCNCYQMTKSSGRKTHCCLPPDSSGDEDIKRVFLPPPGYNSISYTPNKMDSPDMDHRQTYIPDDYLDDQPPSQWRYEDPYRMGPIKGKGTFDSDYPDDVADRSSATLIYNDYGTPDTRPKSVTDYSDRSSSRGGGRTPPPAPPVRSSSKGAANHYIHSQGPPIPDRNYDIDDLPPPNYNPSPQPRYLPPPGSMGSFSSNPNVVTNHNYDRPQMRPSSSLSRTQQVSGDEMRGHLV